MISKSLRSLLARVGHLQSLLLAAILGGVVAVCVPVLIYLLGTIVNCLINAQAGAETLERRSRLSPWLPDLQLAFPATVPPLVQVSVLLVVALALMVLVAALLFVFYRQVQNAAVAFEVSLISKLRGHAKRLATVRTLSAQQTALTDCLDYHLPRVRSSLGRWWRTFPRHAIQFSACVLVAILIQPVLALLTVVATSLVVLIYRFVDRLRRTALPVVRERAAQERDALVGLSIQGPLLESVHNETEVEKRFSDQLTHYRQDAFRSLASSAWKTPVVIVAAGFLACLFVFVISVQILLSEASFSVAGAFTFALCLLAAAMSAVRLQRSWRDMRAVESAAEELERFLALAVEEVNGDKLTSITKVSQQAVLDHVTVQDSSGRKLLENVSAVFKPGLLIGVVASQRLQAHALVELLMGFGRPVSGRMLVDEILVSDLKPGSLAKCSHWVASDGAVVTGTVRDNLCQGRTALDGADVDNAVNGARLLEALQQLPDGLATLITPSDDRLTGDSTFRLGVARAVLRRPSIAVVEEPGGHYDQKTEQQTLEAIRSLVKHDSIVVVLPQRLITLRQCDVVIMLHEHKVADTGTHAELLQRNELYRHLNYLRFNPFRSLAQ